MDGDEFDAVLRTVREFVREVVVPAEDEIEETDDMPAAIREQAKAMGLYGYAIPEEFDGLGLSMSEEVRLAFELGWTTPSFRSMFGTNNGIAGQVVGNVGTAEQKQHYLPRFASGELVASFALSEPEAGSDPSWMRTTAKRDGDDWVIDGQKQFITNATRADVFMVFARTSGERGTTQGISVFVVPAGTDGVSVGPNDHKMGQRGSSTAEVSFAGARVNGDTLVGGQEGVGFGAAMKSLAKGRLHIAAICVGLAQRIQHESIQWSTTSRQGETRIADYQLVQAMLADCHTEIYAGRAMVLEAARSYDDGSDQRLAPSAAKLFCSEMVGRVADRAVQIHGGMGYMRSVPVERFYRDARLFRLYEGTSEVQRTIIARAITR